MKRKAKPKVLNSILIALIVIFVISFSLHVYLSIFKLASFSVLAACDSKGVEILKQKGFIVSGSFGFDDSDLNNTGVIFTSFSDSVLQPVITVRDINDTSTLKHEICHFKQFTQQRLFTCNEADKLFWNEAECYFKQQIPGLYSKDINKFINKSII